ncbi:MAG: FAD-dependent oxidoreductase [Burkholderiales bacterium]|nr:FAD-dependent oxidoreductase [Burkholderiales bacterium]
MTHDVIVIGAGPAGMAAAATAAGLGLRTVVLDEQPSAGGQIYRDVGRVVAEQPRVAQLLGADYTHGVSLVQALERSTAERRLGTLVWDVARDLTVTVLQEGRAAQLHAPQLIAATGAMERASPIPGWTLPGVMNAGAAQIALKSAGAVPAGRIVLAGAGPLLLLVACQLLAAGAAPAAVVETAPAGNRLAALRHAGGALRAWSYLAKGLKMMRRLRAARVPWFTRAENLRVTGTDRAAGLAFVAAGRAQELAADTVLLHHGVVPNTQLSRLLHVHHVWSDEQLAWQVVVDAHGQTSLPGLRVAGDGVSIAGALAAEASGTLAALGAAHALGRIDARELARRSAPFEQALKAEQQIRPFLDALYRPPRFIAEPADETLVCRCEEVTAGRVREMARLGCQGPNQTKFFSRCGMGPCQGRMCGTVVSQILAAEHGKGVAEVGAYRIRAPLKPVPLAALASLAGAAPAETAASSSDKEDVT